MICSFLANLGADVKVKESDGRKFLALYVCTDLFSGGVRKPVWLNVTYHYSEGLAQFLTKGRQVYICGEFLPDKYIDRNGRECVDMKVRAYSILLCTQSNNSPADSVSVDSNSEEPKAEEAPF